MTVLRKLFIADGVGGWLAGVDKISEALEVIDYHHHEIHEEDAFTAETHTLSGTVLTLAFKTPPGTKRAHMTFAFSSESKAHMEVLEGATWTTNTGTVSAPINQFRGSTNESMLLEDKSATPAFTAGGILSAVTAVGGSIVRELYEFSSKQAGGGDANTRQELVLEPDHTYVVELTSDDGSKGMQLRLEWYEHTDSN